MLLLLLLRSASSVCCCTAPTWASPVKRPVRPTCLTNATRTTPPSKLVAPSQGCPSFASFVHHHLLAWSSFQPSCFTLALHPSQPAPDRQRGRGGGLGDPQIAPDPLRADAPSLAQLRASSQCVDKPAPTASRRPAGVKWVLGGRGKADGAVVGRVKPIRGEFRSGERSSKSPFAFRVVVVRLTCLPRRLPFEGRGTMLLASGTARGALGTPEEGTAVEASRRCRASVGLGLASSIHLGPVPYQQERRSAGPSVARSEDRQGRSGMLRQDLKAKAGLGPKTPSPWEPSYSRKPRRSANLLVDVGLFVDPPPFRSVLGDLGSRTSPFPWFLVSSSAPQPGVVLCAGTLIPSSRLAGVRSHLRNNPALLPDHLCTFGHLTCSEAVRHRCSPRLLANSRSFHPYASTGHHSTASHQSAQLHTSPS